MQDYLNSGDATTPPGPDTSARDGDQTGLNLGGFERVDEYGAARVYQVTELNNKVVFVVKFYFYGGILSGWSVEPDIGSYETYRNGRGIS